MKRRASSGVPDCNLCESRIEAGRDRPVRLQGLPLRDNHGNRILTTTASYRTVLNVDHCSPVKLSKGSKSS